MSEFNCPACSKPLTEAVTRNGREIWCCNPKCESTAADMGATGRTPQEAFDVLTQALEAEREADLKEMKEMKGIIAP
jgi:ribosomal protein L37AE/L43A